MISMTHVFKLIFCQIQHREIFSLFFWYVPHFNFILLCPNCSLRIEALSHFVDLLPCFCFREICKEPCAKQLSVSLTGPVRTSKSHVVLVCMNLWQTPHFKQGVPLTASYAVLPSQINSHLTTSMASAHCILAVEASMIHPPFPNQWSLFRTQKPRQVLCMFALFNDHTFLFTSCSFQMLIHLWYTVL